MKRFYSAVAVATTADGSVVTLDGRAVRTPVGQLLCVANPRLAEAMADEWQAQRERIEPRSMPLTQLVSTAIDRVAVHRPAIIQELVNYGATDLLCYRAELPRDLAEHQERVWQPVVDWAAVDLGAELVVTAGILHMAQPAATVARLRALIERYDDLPLTALQSIVAATGSLLLGLAMMEGRLGADQTFAASQLDELYQVELWGEDPEAVTRRELLYQDIQAAARLIGLCQA